MQGIVVKGKLAVTWCDDAYESKWKTHHDFVRMLWVLFAGVAVHAVKHYKVLFLESKALLRSDFEYLLVMNLCLANDFEKLLAFLDGDKKDEMVLPDLCV